MIQKRTPLLPRIIHVHVIVACFTVFCSLASAAEINCLKCHNKLATNKVQHVAVAMGCPTCHPGINDATVPHKNSGKNAMGLSSDQPGLCYECHDKMLYSKKTVHAAIGMGCTGCHNPHSSKNANLLISVQPDLCYKCHDKALFSKKNVHAAVGMGCTGCHNPHATDNPKLLKSNPPELCFSCHDKLEFVNKNVHSPVAGGMCLACHTPHSSDNMALLIKEPLQVCLSCHGDIENKPHAINGINNAGHPIGKRNKKDPKRPDKIFYCGSCHNPHSSDSIKLFRYPAKFKMGFCTNCHKY